MVPAPRRTLPALSEHRWLRFGAFFAFYVVQGLPIGLTLRAFPTWLTARDLGPERIADFLFLSGLPWAFKFVAGPVMDRFAFPAMGLRRPWVIGAQLALAISGVALFFVHDPLAQFWALTIACTALNTFAAFQDVAVDGLAISVLPVNERGRANAFMIGGQTAGVALATAASVPLMNNFGIPAAGALMFCSVGAISLVALLCRERPGERVWPWSEGAAHPAAPRPIRETGRLFREIGRLLLLPMSMVLLAAEFTYRILEGVTLVWWPEVAIHRLGYTDNQFAFWTATASVVAVVAGVGIGVLVDRLGAKRAAALGLLGNAVFYAVLWLCSARLDGPGLAIAAVTAGGIGAQWMFIATVSLFMGLCGVRVAASQFAVYMALSNLGQNSGAKVYAWIDGWISADGIFLFMAGGYLVSLAILRAFDLDRHQRKLATLGES